MPNDKIRDLAPWFHNLHLPDGRQTFPDHWLGDFPAEKWRQIEPHLSGDLSGWRVLDIGCNAGFYSFELAKRGAAVTGIDVDPHYLDQARWAAAEFGLGNVRFQQAQVYDLAGCAERFDLILFMGVFYHLRYPLLALDIIASLRPRLMLFQSLTQGGRTVSSDIGQDCDFETRDRLASPHWPNLAFIPGTFAGDPTNWWAPNHAGVMALLQAAGFRVIAEPGHEIYLCKSDPSHPLVRLDLAEFSAATGRKTSDRVR